jgi:Ferritin-like domain
MTPPVTLELRDPEAIIRGDGRDEPGMTRATLLRRAALGTGALIGGGLLVRNVPAAFAQASTDTDVLNLLYLNESLEVALYGAAARGGALSGAALTFARQLERNETVHRDLVRKALGSSARTLPPFDFGDVPRNQGKFLTTALALENGDVGAINGAGPLVSKPLLAVAGQVVSVEGRQAAWIRRIVYGPTYAAASQYPAPLAYDEPLTAAQVKAALAKTGFIKGQI